MMDFASLAFGFLPGIALLIAFMLPRGERSGVIMLSMSFSSIFLCFAHIIFSYGGTPSVPIDVIRGSIACFWLCVVWLAVAICWLAFEYRNRKLVGSTSATHLRKAR
jgi:hypothetical protein